MGFAYLELGRGTATSLLFAAAAAALVDILNRPLDRNCERLLGLEIVENATRPIFSETWLGLSDSDV